MQGATFRWPAEVRRISDTVDPATRSIGMIVAVRDPYPAAGAGPRPPLIKGMFVKVEIYAPTVEGMTLLPRTALQDGRAMVADADDRLRFVPVETAYVDGDVESTMDGWISDGRLFSSIGPPLQVFYDPMDDWTVIIPEPGTLSLLAIGGLVVAFLALLRRRRK